MSAPRHADRVGLAPWLSSSVAGAAAVAAGVSGLLSARGRLEPLVGLAAGVSASLLLVLGLTSLSIRTLARGALAASAVVLVRYGALEGTLTESGQWLVVWLLAATAVLVLTDRIGTDAGAALTPPAGAASAAAPSAGRSPASTARLVLGVAGLIGVVVLLVAPVVAPRLDRPVAAGEGPRLGRSADGSTALRSSDSLDMTSRPELGDAVVFTVAADRATFWRAQIFDTWDGRTWRRSDDGLLPLVGGTDVVPAEDDLAASGSDELTQRFRLEAEATDLVFAAATPARVTSAGPVVQRPDGTLLARPMGKGAAYTVVSRRIPLSEEALRAAEDGVVPGSLSARYATSSVVSERVAQAATRVTRGLTNDYDRIRALEAWMGSRTEYSLDAPLAPEGVDVVDDFLFESRLGWCEQIASSLVVLARANGIPARLVTGYVPGERDTLTGEFTVRQRDAHAWAEVWFPDLGWVPFDPTADVALAGDDAPDATVLEWLADHAAYLAVGALVVGLAVGPLRSILLRRWRSRRTRRAHDAELAPALAWALGADRQLDRLGAQADRSRAPDESARAYAVALAEHYEDDRLAEVGQAVDDALFAPEPPDEARRAAADAVLAVPRTA